MKNIKQILVVWGHKRPCTPIEGGQSPTITCGLMKQISSYGYPYILDVYET